MFSFFFFRIRIWFFFINSKHFLYFVFMGAFLITFAWRLSVCHFLLLHTNPRSISTTFGNQSETYFYLCHCLVQLFINYLRMILISLLNTVTIIFIVPTFSVFILMFSLTQHKFITETIQLSKAGSSITSYRHTLFWEVKLIVQNLRQIGNKTIYWYALMNWRIFWCMIVKT